MMTNEISFTLEDLYGPVVGGDEALNASLNRSLNPRGPDMLYDAIAAQGLAEHHHLLDIGSRDAKYACELARRFGCSALAVDPIPHNLTLAQGRIAASGLAHLVTAAVGTIASIPAPDHSFDYIWSRDMIPHIPDLHAAFREVARVLRPGGIMLIYCTLATDRLEPAEATRLLSPLVVLPANMHEDNLETAWRDAGFRAIHRETIAGEWREHWEEDGSHTTAKQLLHISRMLRDRARLVAELGETQYEIELADAHWGVYQMLGKLRPMLYILKI